MVRSQLPALGAVRLRDPRWMGDRRRGVPGALRSPSWALCGSAHRSPVRSWPELKNSFP